MRSRFVVGCGIAMLVFAASRCGGGGDSYTPPTQPTPPPPTGGGGGGSAATITILGDRGAQSFNPNPSPGSQGSMLVFRNNDAVVHRIVFNDNSFDTGDIAPGQTSSARAIPTNGANYHCSLHPTMVGAINASGGAPPPCEGIYC
jgi:plastocyanin